jgi:aryl-alcohol dehydrogenase-like predicted oxidoreductase
VQYASIPGLSDRVSRLVLGSAALSSMAPEAVDDLLDAWIAAGGNVVETAHDYGLGTAEMRIGGWLAGRGRRDDVLVVSKGAQHDLTSLARRVTPEAIARDLAESLERLRVDALDLLILHRDDPTTPVGPIVEALNEHLQSGRIRAFGGSNWTHERLAVANAYAASRGLRGFVVSSPNVALAVPKEPIWHEVLSIAGDRAALDWYRRTQLPVMPWSSQARGFFAGPFAADDPRSTELARVYDSAENEERRRRAGELAGRKGTTPTQIALAWVLNQPFPTFPLIGPRTVGELHDCIGALDVSLSADELAWLNLERA